MTRNQLAIAAECVAALARRGLVLVALGVALAGCETAQEDTRSIWSDYRQRHPISIVEKDRKLEIFVGSARNGLTPEQRADVLAYAQTWRGEGTGRFIIDQPSGARNARAAAIALSEIRSILAASGIPPQAVKVQHVRVADRNTLAVISINYPHLAAQAGPCGRWPDNLGPGEDPRHLENIQYWNFGCATQRNLAAMVANPADLVQPRSEAPVYAGRRTTVLDKYRKGDSTAATNPNPDKGAISDLGK
jgi:pilus assembly protein CpaD